MGQNVQLSKYKKGFDNGIVVLNKNYQNWANTPTYCARMHADFPHLDIANRAPKNVQTRCIYLKVKECVTLLLIFSSF